MVSFGVFFYQNQQGVPGASAEYLVPSVSEVLGVNLYQLQFGPKMNYSVAHFTSYTGNLPGRLTPDLCLHYYWINQEKIFAP